MPPTIVHGPTPQFLYTGIPNIRQSFLFVVNDFPSEISAVELEYSGHNFFDEEGFVTTNDGDQKLIVLFNLVSPDALTAKSSGGLTITVTIIENGTTRTIRKTGCIVHLVSISLEAPEGPSSL
jgi:hypothetical protein